MKAIKGFDANLQCRGFQFEVGKTYTHEGDVSACKSGFHAIPEDKHPLAVFDYYAPAGSRFCIVDVGGDIARQEDKVAAQILTVGKEIGISGLVADAVAFVTSRAKLEGQSATGDHGAASATGDHGAASATGYQGAASATGYQGAASATGDQGAASATGYQGAASATGWKGAASATGDHGAASATGYQGAASATGYQGAASATGWKGAASATGWKGAASATGWKGMVIGAEGNALFAVERDDEYNIVSAACGIVGHDGIEAGVWYICAAGKLVPANA